MVDPLLEQALACVDDFDGRIFRNWPGAVTRVVGAQGRIAGEPDE